LKDGRIHVGEPLRGFRGVLTGVPVEEDHGPASSKQGKRD
jgi:hypothetical protein